MTREAPMDVLSVASEAFPLVKTGGLADVAGALPAALAAAGVRVRTLLPAYPAVREALTDARVLHRWPTLMGGSARLLAGEAAGLELLALDAPHLYDRPGNPYLGPDGKDWPDNALRFGALARAAADIALGGIPGLRCDLVHAHDWQAGLLPAYLHYAGQPHPPVVLTIHNLAFQGRFEASLLAPLGLPKAAMAMDGVEYFGGIGFLKAGIALSDHVTTVSPTYAAEIRTPEGGMSLDGLLRHRGVAVSGILNGLDTQVWNPAQDALIAAAYDARRLAARRTNKIALQTRLGLTPELGTLLFGVVSRLTEQKGMDLLLAALPDLCAQDAQLALLGSGDASLERGFTEAVRRYPAQVAVVTGYDETLAHGIQAGADALLVPSRFEPCGLTQLAALRYGAVPVVARTGGLADTVVDANEMALASKQGTGIVFSPVTRAALVHAIDRTAALWQDQAAWRGLQRRGMATDVGWARPAARYAALYRALLDSRRADRRT